jgi:hypothetical protein
MGPGFTIERAVQTISVAGGQDRLGVEIEEEELARAFRHNACSVRFLTASELLLDLNGKEAAHALERRLRVYARPALLAIDEIGYLGYDGHAAGGQPSLRTPIPGGHDEPFKQWMTVFPNASCAVALIDRPPIMGRSFTYTYHCSIHPDRSVPWLSGNAARQQAAIEDIWNQESKEVTHVSGELMVCGVCFPSGVA